MSGRDQIVEFLKERNKAIVAEHQAGVASSSTIRVLSVPRRSSGEMQTTPVSPLEVDGRRYVVAGMGERAHWALNARASGWGILQNGSKVERVRLVEIPEAARGAVLRQFPALVPNGVQFFTQLYGVGADPDAFEQLAPHCLVFRVEPAD